MRETRTKEEAPTAVQFKLRAGYRLKAADAERIAKRLLELEMQLGRSVEPADVLADARSTQSPLHEIYAAQDLWDDRAAAERARLEYARYLLQAIEFVRVDEQGREVNVPLFRNVPRFDEFGGRGYSSIGRIMADSRSLAAVVEYEKNIMKACARRLRQIAKLEAFADEIENLIDRMVAKANQKE